ncbi:hypothetical protein NDU88_007820 [Pleurodeles waltl]|uniref:Uncharacterized protein n=1 Tax=Pleurodeles waltl TaxID=8319 RepID=A0AAV7PMR9_PLEWA|nr:hypothetical protein NDU88_007820 [Pleurodeles waltl]
MGHRPLRASGLLGDAPADRLKPVHIPRTRRVLAIRKGLRGYDAPTAARPRAPQGRSRRPAKAGTYSLHSPR